MLNQGPSWLLGRASASPTAWLPLFASRKGLPSLHLQPQAWGPWPRKSVAGGPTSDGMIWLCMERASSMVKIDL